MGSTDVWDGGSVFGHGRVVWDTAGFQFLAVSLTSGTVLAEFPDLQISNLSYRFEETTSGTMMLPWRNIPSNWGEATIPYGVAILLVRGSTVLWGGIVVKRERTLQGRGLSLTVATVEHYLDSVYVRDHTYSNRDQCEIVKDLVSSTLEGHRFMLSVETSPSSIRRDRTLEDYTSGYGANMVWAVGSTTGEDRLRSDVMVDDQSYRPIVEHVVRTSSSITQKETLNAHASASLEQLRDGTNTMSMTLSLLAAPIVYEEWRPGDVVAWTVADDDGRFTGFDHGEARVVGYDIDFSGMWTITPVLQ